MIVQKITLMYIKTNNRLESFLSDEKADFAQTALILVAVLAIAGLVSAFFAAVGGVFSRGSGFMGG